MKHFLIKIIVSFFLLTNQVFAQDNQQRAQQINETVFGKIGLALPIAERKKTEQLIYNLLTASNYTLHHVATLLVPQLKKDLADTDQKVTQLKGNNQKVPYSLFYTQFTLKSQIDHLNNYAQTLKEQLTVWQTIKGFSITSYEYLQSLFGTFFGYQPQESVAQAISDQVLAYITYERENILFNYQKLLTFFAVTKEVAFPQLINFWNTPEIQQQLKIRAKQTSQEVEVQFEGLILSFALQGIVMAGGELATQWIDEDDAKFYEELKGKQKKLSTQFNEFKKGVDQQEKTARTNISTAFTSSQEKLNEEFAASNARLRDEIVYLNQSINLDKPLKRYLESQISWDKYFQTSPMLTPQSTYPWYNIFNIFTTGDWEFDANSTSFWQNGLAKFPKTLYWDKTTKKSIFTNDPSINSIFNEYITDKLSYDIEVECTIITNTYPFFAGVMFNRGRWISGDPERLWWYRLIGLYGQETKAGDTTTQAVNLSFAQQKLAFPSGAPEVITSPLEQIVKSKTTPLNYQLDNAAVQNLSKNPTTFVFKLTNKPSDVVVELDKKETDAAGKETVTKLYSGALSKLDQYIYQYHGIGFMAVGCIAEFKIIKPTELVYSNKQIEAFKKQLATQMNSAP